MKPKVIFFILFFIITSCEGLLDLEPTDSINSENAIDTEVDLQKAIRGCYDALQADNYYGRMLIVANEIGSDNAYNGGTILEFAQFNNNNVQEDNIYLEGLWFTPYVAINRCNTSIYYASRMKNLTEDKKNEYLAELYFLRALNYFNLTRLFKNIPLILEPTFSDNNLNVGLSDQNVIFEQILSDLAFADNKINNNDPHFASDLAVKTLLAKVNLEIEDYIQAIKYADHVLTSNKKLLDKYESLFTIPKNTESIFELSYTELLSDRNRLAEYCLPTSLGGRYEIAPEKGLLESFEPNDTRKNLFLGEIPYCNKYSNITSGDDNVYIFRLAELYLLRAEARAKINGNLSLIRNDINKIRNRAGLTSIYSNSYSELLQIIETERKHEFAFEGHRRFDLVRTNRATDILGISENNYYFPIPLTEINSNSEID